MAKMVSSSRLIKALPRRTMMRLSILLACGIVCSGDQQYNNGEDTYGANSYGASGYSNQYYNGGGNNDGSNYNGYSSSLPISVCEDSVVEVTYLTVSCDSPYTFYYGNGVNRNSPTCDYGDKATISGTVNVVDDLQYGDHVYINMAIYDDQRNLLVTAGPTNFCDNLVNSDCTVKGSYSFTTKLKLATPNYGNRSHFYPDIQMAFSSRPDSSYNLGAVNTQCRKWDQDNPSYVDWGNGPPKRSPIVTFTADNGMLIGTCIAVFLFAAFVWKKSRDDRDDIDFTLSTKDGLMSLD